MNIEQRSPNQPNFSLVILLAGIVLIAVLTLAYFFVDFDGKHLTFRHRHAHPTSQLILPASPSLTRFA